MNRLHEESLSVQCSLVRIGPLFGMQVAFSVVEKQTGMKTMYSCRCEAL